MERGNTAGVVWRGWVEALVVACLLWGSSWALGFALTRLGWASWATFFAVAPTVGIVGLLLRESFHERRAKKKIRNALRQRAMARGVAYLDLVDLEDGRTSGFVRRLRG